MATRKGPTKGPRVLVKLPFGETKPGTDKKPGKSQYVRMKQGVAKALGFDVVDKIPLQAVKTKNGTINRLSVAGSMRRQSITVIFANAKTIAKSGSYKTVSFPLGSGCTITDAVKYFEDKKSLGVVAVRTSHGQTIRFGADKSS